eukprot:TRINITY_DN1826_c0_g1_i1.p1 TRINITY_DN1826_c0_g1~~TRINITY_DN1826_c0_g1_i1.p1  ORF type:complete len:227 (-),score=38.57 TRINITY_DN1826_c0_g1_i1:136-783(-)
MQQPEEQEETTPTFATPQPTSARTPLSSRARRTWGSVTRIFRSPLKHLQKDPVSLKTEGKDPGQYFGRLLIMSVLEDNLEDLQSFLDKGADPNFIDQDNFTPLIVAVQHQLNDCAMLLMDHGAFTSLKTSHYASPIQLAIESQNTTLIDYMLKKINGLEEKASMNIEDLRAPKKRRTEAPEPVSLDLPPAEKGEADKADGRIVLDTRKRKLAVRD